jgi:hypothetical protein
VSATRVTGSSSRVLLSTVAFVAACLAAPRDARATLGGDLASVADNQQHMGGTRQVVRILSGERHDLLLPSGTLVHEYISPGGAVYGISWRGPRIPDLRELLGAHFAELANRDRTGGHNRMTVTGADLVVQSTGHRRSFEGRAWIPSLVPAGVRPEVTLGEEQR